jgi:hypothetical protein
MERKRLKLIIVFLLALAFFPGRAASKTDKDVQTLEKVFLTTDEEVYFLTVETGWRIPLSRVKEIYIDDKKGGDSHASYIDYAFVLKVSVDFWSKYIRPHFQGPPYQGIAEIYPDKNGKYYFRTFGHQVYPIDSKLVVFGPEEHHILFRSTVKGGSEIAGIYLNSKKTIIQRKRD